MKFFGYIQQSLNSAVKKCSKLTCRRREEKSPRVKEVNIMPMTFIYIATLLRSEWQKALLYIFGSSKGSQRLSKLKASEKKKLFFFRSSSSNGDTNQVSQSSTDKQFYKDKKADGNDKSRIKNQVIGNCTASNTPFLRRGLPSSSAVILDGVAGRRNTSDQIGAPGSTSNGSLKQFGRRSSRRTLTPERQSRPKFFESAAVQDAHRYEKDVPIPSFGMQYDSSECSSQSSSNVSNGVLGQYIDAEQQLEKSAAKSKFFLRNHIANGNDLRKQALVVQHDALSSPTNDRKQKPKSQSFREIDATRLQISSKDRVENGYVNESPRKLMKLAKPAGNSNGVPQGNCMLGEFNGDSDEYLCEETSGFAGRDCFLTDNCKFMKNSESEEDIEFKLFRKLKEAKDQAILFSEELEQEKFLQHTELNLPSLVQTIRGLNVDRVNMSCKVSSLLKDWIADRASLREELRETRAELDSKTRRLEKKKNELQSALERELDRRSGKWSLKLKKYQAKEHRLRERARELAEMNVFLQREVSSYSERETGIRSRVTHFEQQLEDLTTKVEKMRQKNQNLKKNLLELQGKYKASEEDRDCLQRNYEEKVKECKDLHRSKCPVLGDESCHSNQKSEDVIQSELRAETLPTALLREKLYSKELEIEQLRAELAASIRGSDIHKFEVQNALDSLSCLTHKMKDLELQMIKKDDNINQLQNKLQDCTKELTIVREILPKVTEERDMMWGEVKQYSEKTMLLNREIMMLKKEIQALDEDVLLKDGQISILKDAVDKPFDLLASPDSEYEYLVK